MDDRFRPGAWIGARNLREEQQEPLLELGPNGVSVLLCLREISFRALLGLLNQIFPADADAFYYTCTMSELLLLVYISTGYRLSRCYEFQHIDAFYFHTCARIYNRKPDRSRLLTLGQMPDKRAWRHIATNIWLNVGPGDDDRALIEIPDYIWPTYLRTCNPVRFEEMAALITYLLDLPRNDYLCNWRATFLPGQPVLDPVKCHIDRCHAFLQHHLLGRDGNLLRHFLEQERVAWLPGLAEAVRADEDPDIDLF